VTLLQAHRILIGAAILLFVLYAGLALSGRLPGGGRARRVQGGLSLLAAGGLAAYLWRLGDSGTTRIP
jgi:hypothetical protein